MGKKKEIVAPPGYVNYKMKKLSDSLEKTIKNHCFVVNEIYKIKEIINRARVTITVNGGGNSFPQRKGVIIKFIAEAVNGHYYSFKHYAGEPSLGKWKCIAADKELSKVLL